MKKLNESASESENSSGVNRRDFLKKAGKFAVYTPPAVMMLMQPSFASSGQKGSWMGKPQGNKSWKPQGNKSWQASD